jgi:hypothetical protein
MYASAPNFLRRGTTIPPIFQEMIAMNLLKRLSAMFLALAFVSAVGCANTQESPGEFVTDAWITTKVKATLIEDPLVKARDISVETDKGMVHLSGFVSSREAMTQAVRLTRSIKGVTAVKNDMRVK